MTPNALVGFNLERARKLRGLTQAEAGAALEPYLGVAWTAANFGKAERSYRRGAPVRHFTVDELVAFAYAFELPIVWFLLPPEDEQDQPEVIAPGAASRGAPPSAVLASLFYVASPEVEERIARTEALSTKGREELTRLYRERLHERVAKVVSAEASRPHEFADQLANLVDVIRKAATEATWDVTDELTDDEGED